MLTERDRAWVNLNHDGPRWLEDGSFLWTGQGQDGPQLEHRDKGGALRKAHAHISLSAIDLSRAWNELGFPPNPSPWRCRRCDYRTVCDEGGAAAAARTGGVPFDASAVATSNGCQGDAR